MVMSAKSCVKHIWSIRPASSRSSKRTSSKRIVYDAYDNWFVYVHCKLTLCIAYRRLCGISAAVWGRYVVVPEWSVRKNWLLQWEADVQVHSALTRNNPSIKIGQTWSCKSDSTSYYSHDKVSVPKALSKNNISAVYLRWCIGKKYGKPFGNHAVLIIEIRQHLIHS